MFAALAAVVALSASPLAAAPRHPDAGDDVLIARYFKDVVERPVSVVEIAVLAPADVRGALDERLMAIGADASQLREVGHGDLLFVSVPGKLRTGPGVREFVADLLEDPRIPFATPVTFDELGAPRFALPEVFVQFDARVAPARALAIVADSGIGAIVQFDRQPGNVHLVQSASRNGFDLLDAVAALADRPEVLFAECDEVIRVFPTLIPNDPFFINQWQLNNTGQFVGFVADIDLNAPEAWNLHTGTASMIVAVLDDGVQQNHPDINQIPGVNMTSLPGGSGGPLTQYDNHGTAVAGLITATMNNSIGVAGICPGCRTISIKIAYDTTPGWGWTSQASWVADGVWEASSRGAKVTNSSFTASASSLITNAYTLTNAAGLLHFGSAGNDSVNSLSYPASLSAVHAVTAINGAGNKASFSSWGSGTMFTAPGVDTFTTDRTGSAGYASGDYDWFDGTSAASPLVAGTAALVWSSKPSLTSAQVLSILQNTAMDLGAAGYDTTFGHGLPRADAAVAQAMFSGVCPGSGNCYASNGSPGCSVGSCCFTVCAQDPFCCNNQWDGICASAAVNLCTNCGASNAGSCYASNGSPGCNQQACCAAVCAADPFCCNSTWDSICANQTLNLCIPQNDTCSAAIELTTGVAKSFNTTMASTTGPTLGSCDGTGDNQIHKDVWYRWTATCDGYLTISTCGSANFDTKIAVYGPGFLGGTCPQPGILGGILIGCNDDGIGCAGGSSKLSIPVQAGTLYRIRVGGRNGASGTGSVIATCGIPHDVCADALPIGDGSTPFSTIGATTDGPNIANCDTSTAVPIGRDVWFRYTATCTGPVTISTCGAADFDTKIAVWQPGILGAPCPGGSFLSASLLGCNDDAPGCSGWTSSLTVNVVAGTSYRIQVGGFGSQSGTGTITINCGTNCPGNLNGDGVVDAADLAILLGQWGLPGSADLDGDGVVGAADLAILLGSWGSCS